MIILGKVRPFSRPHAEAHPQVLIIALGGLVAGNVFSVLWERMGLLHDQVTVSVTRPDWPVWS